MTGTDDRVNAWVDALYARHAESLRRPELLKAIRALSARYVERRATLPHRSPVDSAGKRAAFAAFYAPLHLLTVRAIVSRLEADVPDEVCDLGCGTGAASAGWLLAGPEPRSPRLVGIDRDGWSLEEARWNWASLGLRGTTRRADLVDAIGRADGSRARRARREGIVLGWSANELRPDARGRLLTALRARHRSGAVILVVEPVARGAAPWWQSWADALVPLGARNDDWSMHDVALPPTLARLDADAGFDRRTITARSLYLPPASA